MLTVTMEKLPELAALSWSQWALLAVAALCIGLSKAGFGGFGMLTVLIMAHVLPARASTGVVLPMLILADLFAVASFRHHARWEHLRRLFLPTALGVIGGFVIMPWIPDRRFAPVIGGVVLLMVAIHYAGRLRPNLTASLPESRHFANFIGIFSGLTTMLANAAGAVMTLYLLARRVPKMEFVGTAAIFFFAVNLFKVPFSVSLGLIRSDSLLLNLALAPAVAAGILLGRSGLRHVPQRLFEEILLAFSLIAAIRLLMQ